LRIVRLEVQNYRRLPDIDLTIDGHAVLVGPNESGKSSILRMLHTVLGLPHSQLIPSLGLRDFSDPDRPLSAQVTFRDFDDNDRAAFPDEIAVDANDDESLRVRFEASIDPGDPENRTVSRFCPDGTGHQLARTQLDAIGWRLVSANRSLHHELGPATSGVLKSVLNSLELGDDVEALAAAIDQLHESLNDAETLARFRSDLAAGITKAFSRNLGPDDIRLLTSAEMHDAPLADVVLHLIDAETSGPLLEQSDGLRSIALLALFAQRSSGSQVVGLDEPELHLHPRAREAIGRLLASSDVQQFIATHSGTLAAQFGPQAIISVSREQAPKQLAPGHGAADPAFMTRWWRNELVSTLTAHRIVLVEGPADRILLEAVADRLEAAEFQRQAHVLELTGAGNFNAVIDLLGPNGFGLACAGMCDEDAESAWAEALGVAVSDLEDLAFYTCRADLEAEVVRCLGAGRVLDLWVAGRARAEVDVLDACNVPDRGALSDAGLAAYWRSRKDKVWLAISIAAHLDPTDAARLTTLASLVTSIA
jgi:putative ATP-dependent endonuclease of the OLD family